MEIDEEHVDTFVSALENDFYITREAVIEAGQRKTSFNVIHLATMLKLDFFVMKGDALAAEEMNRAQSIEVTQNPSRTLKFASAEDIVLEKLRWYEMGNRISERQWKDVLGVLKTCGRDLDVGYMRSGAKKLKLDQLLEDAFDAVDMDI